MCEKINNYSKITKQDDENFSADMANENRELFKRALAEAMDLKIRKLLEETKDIEIPPPSRRSR